MRRWGVVVTLFYALVLLVLSGPVASVLTGGRWDPGPEEDAVSWLWGGALIAGQALLFARVDRSWRKLRPRTHVGVTATAMALATGLLLFALVGAVFAAAYGDEGWPGDLDDISPAPAWLGLWAVWAVVFVLYYRRAPARMADAVAWLLKGSILELLVAVPAHVIVRRRDDCSAPVVTAFGIITGTAVMLMCFGPGVIALYQRRKQQYRRPSRNENGSP